MGVPILAFFAVSFLSAQNSEGCPTPEFSLQSYLKVSGCSFRGGNVSAPQEHHLKRTMSRAPLELV